jgi:hypothetical protein
VFVVHLAEAQIARAWIESKKLNKFYHYRFDSKKISNLRQEVQDMLKEGAAKGKSIGKDRKWRIEKYDDTFNKLAERKLSFLKRNGFGAYEDRG